MIYGMMAGFVWRKEGQEGMAGDCVSVTLEEELVMLVIGEG